MKKYLFLLFAAVISASAQAALSSLFWVYLCEPSGSFSVIYDQRSATVSSAYGVLRLSQAPVASGMHYTDGRNTLRGKGRDAEFMLANGVILKDCKAHSP